MTEQKTGSRSRKARRSLNGRILGSTTLNILVLVIVSCVIMASAMQSLANSILLDSLRSEERRVGKEC